MGKSILIISGEASGDLHGASLIRALRELDPGLSVKGMGGERMRQAGLKGLDSRDVSVVGIVEVVSKFPAILRTFRRLRAMLDAEHFDCVVLIDFPDFNLRFAREAKKRRVPVVYYISPQVWAWRKGRIKKIARLVDKMLVVFPFEKALYRDAGVDVEFVGHPLKDTARCELTREEAREGLGLAPEATVVSLLPGSRNEEVRRLLPPMVAAARIAAQKTEHGISFLLPAAATIDEAFLNECLAQSTQGGEGPEIKIVRGRMYEALRASDAAVVASGTATLETALIGTPMVIIYAVSNLTYRIARALVNLEHAGLPNIVANREIVPELIQTDVTAENIADRLLGIITEPDTKQRMQEDLREVASLLNGGQEQGAPGAAANAAAMIMKTIGLDT